MTGTIERNYQMNKGNSMHLTPTEVSARLRLSIGTLSNWRVRGEGPRFIKMGRKVLYPLAEIEAFEQKQLRASTAQNVA